MIKTYRTETFILVLNTQDKSAHIRIAGNPILFHLTSSDLHHLRASAQFALDNLGASS